MSWTPKAAASAYKDEIVVFVLSPLGQEVGSFTWPRNATLLLKLCNRSRSGYHFAWNDKNDFNEDMGSPKLEMPIALQKTLAEFLWGQQPL